MDRGRLQSAVCRCVIKTYPGLKEFVRDPVRLYPTNAIEVAAYSQPPHFLMFDASNEYLGDIYVQRSWSSDDIVRVLGEAGIVLPGEEGKYHQPGFPDAGSCEGDL